MAKKKKITEESLYLADLTSRFNALVGNYELEESYNDESLEHKLLVEFLCQLDVKENNIWFKCPFDVECKKIMLERNNVKRLECLDKDNNFYPLRDCDDEIFHKLLNLYEIEY